MPKKKKTQLKPVARGFSVTSVPKKPSLLSDNPEVTAAQSEAGTPKEGILQAETTQQAHGSAEGVASSHQTAEEQSMQDLIDKLQEKAEKEIVRMVKAIETDRRLSGSLPLADLDARIVNQILSMAREPRSSEATRLTDDSDDKVLARLGITYGVLRRLGYTEDVVERCLRAIDSIDLDDAYEWLLMNCTDDELRPHSFTTESRMSMQRPASTAVPSTPSDTATLRTDTLLSTLTPPSQPGDPRLHGSAHNPIKSGHTKDPTFTPESPEDNPNLQYVRLKMQIDDIEAPRKAKLGATDSFTRDLQARLQVVKAHYLFDERDANNQYLSERRRADAATFQARLRGDLVTTRKTHDALDVSALAKPEAIVSPSTPHGLSSAPLVKEPPEETHDIFDSDDAEGGGLFELLDEMPSTDVTETGVTIKVRDMPLPKGKFERTSKAFLRNVIDKLDKFAVLTYQIISGASRAKRASLTIRWGLGNFSEWAMEDVACYDTSQAEQYIATVALYDLTFPTTEGFASATAAPGNGHTFFRQLSPAFRELWDELEATRKSSDDAVNRSIWTKLRNIVEAKCSRKKSQRNDLPIAPYRERIVECLEISQILVLSGETGCGKSTQVPAFILEDQLSRGKACRIYCTEPRRISAISLAHRVSRELGDPPGAVGTNASLVGYSIRLENHTSRNTRLAYVTYGIALRMLEGASGSGVALDEITHIIIDEVHERSIESDFLLIVLKALLLQRPQLKYCLIRLMPAHPLTSCFPGSCSCRPLLMPRRYRNTSAVVRCYTFLAERSQ
ncbi:hypothetical protein BC834DRAFT_1069 [Gloeopeniophorella convolvens]|nr:hypothetical protein BC834DRAFT_1069 [Gloeopeniophorella convolvens]